MSREFRLSTGAQDREAGGSPVWCDLKAFQSKSYSALPSVAGISSRIDSPLCGVSVLASLRVLRASRFSAARAVRFCSFSLFKCEGLFVAIVCSFRSICQRIPTRRFLPAALKHESSAGTLCRCEIREDWGACLRKRDRANICLQLERPGFFRSAASWVRPAFVVWTKGKLVEIQLLGCVSQVELAARVVCYAGSGEAAGIQKHTMDRGDIQISRGDSATIFNGKIFGNRAWTHSVHF
jgi:hypothetical protein